MARKSYRNLRSKLPGPVVVGERMGRLPLQSSSGALCQPNTACTAVQLGGAVMSGPVNVYVIFYGTWNASEQDVITNFIGNIGVSQHGPLQLLLLFIFMCWRVYMFPKKPSISLWLMYYRRVRLTGTS
jgi:hypothetical protein